jgi:hypothetical protein
VNYGYRQKENRTNDMRMKFEEKQKRYEISLGKFEEKTGLKEGAHVRYIGIAKTDGHLEHPQYCGYPSDPRGILDFDTIYEIECLILARSYSLVKLVGFRKEHFSTSVFEAINKDERKKCLIAGGRLHYIGTTNNVLNYGTIYEVESVERNSLGVGYDAVKLVGFKESFDRTLFEKVLLLTSPSLTTSSQLKDLQRRTLIFSCGIGNRVQ